jgi:hypothetical protein
VPVGDLDQGRVPAAHRLPLAASMSRSTSDSVRSPASIEPSPRSRTARRQPSSAAPRPVVTSSDRGLPRQLPRRLCALAQMRGSDSVRARALLTPLYTLAGGATAPVPR